MSLNLKDLDDAEQFQKHFVLPIVEGVKAEIRPLVDRVDRQEKEIENLKKNQGRALVGFGALAFLVSTTVGLGLDWLRKKFGL